MNSDLLKQKVAEAALNYIEIGDVIGVGTGSTVNHFIEVLHKVKGKIDGTVASSEATASKLKQAGIPVLDLNRTGNLPLYVDGADEATRNRHLIKGGGGALTREKIVAAASEKFVCIVDNTKVVDVLGKFPLPIEVLPFAQSLVSRQLLKFGGLPELRAGFATDSGNIIIDVRNLDMLNPVELEGELDHLAGVVSNGIFARRPADMLLIGYPDEIQSI